MMDISTSTWVQKSARLPFADLARAVRPLSRVPREDRERVEAEHGPCVLMADHSAFGASRKWDGNSVQYVPDPGMNGGWHVLTWDSANSLKWVSGSGSTLEAACVGMRGVALTLRVPMEGDAEPYRGTYWDVFHRACGVEEVVWSVVEGPSPHAQAVCPDGIVDYPDHILDWGSAWVKLEAPQYYFMVAPLDEAGPVDGQIMSRVDVLPIQDAARIRMAIDKGDC